MNVRHSSIHSHSLLRSLADFRFELRSFLCFSEQAASKNGLQPQQHQLLLQVAGAPETATVTIAYAASRLGLKHNSVVELVDRSENEGLLERVADATDKRRILLRVTRKGGDILNKLTGEHARELNVMAPGLMAALEQVRAHASVPNDAEAK